MIEWFRSLTSKIAAFFADRGIAKGLRDRFPAPYEDVVYFRREFTVELLLNSGAYDFLIQKP